ncbi:hypothetical protein FB45DRAFT_901378 [Roridomyces roridus]|uniref:Uncharacterized protein n=1 Tax=Roridomyces roridus TaxID=1738132 RepID=A0AAD7FTJ6_9AGAR|nr:hypothetical protein FB45DRAFT_901378 [Roridomyces roridus]
MSATRQPHMGVRTLVLGIDIGTTFSGISYSILEPGQVPIIKSITRFPGQQEVGGDSKIPTAIYYDKAGIIRAEGASTALPTSVEQAGEEEWQYARWFKLHLRPPNTEGPEIPPLPHRMSVISVFSDFLRYLFDCAKTFIEETHPGGAALWRSMEDSRSIELVITHPNGWEGKQQNQLRDAAVVAGLSLITSDDAGHGRLRFVTEGEASLHFCIENGLMTEAIARGRGVVIVDAGGGTVDVSTYRLNRSLNESGKYEEIAPPQCLFQGSVFVTQRAYQWIEAHLAGSKFTEDVGNIAENFDTTGKLSFQGDEETVSVKFGRPGDNDPRLNIRSGMLKIPGAQVRAFFEPSISAIVAAVRDQCVSAHPIPVASVFLVGGFAANNWLFAQLQSRLEFLGVELARPDTHVNKAVADGAVSFCIDHHVSARVARFTYGVVCSQPYNPANFEHAARASKRYKGVTGLWMVPGAFDTLLKKGVQVHETTEFRSGYYRRDKDPGNLRRIEVEVLNYRGQAGDPRWVDAEQENYQIVCRVEADTRRLVKRRSDYYELQFDVVLSFGLTELKAQVAWKEQGVEKRGAAQIVY